MGVTKGWMMLGAKELGQFFDHTNLNPAASPTDITRLCSEAVEFNFFSVCVHPNYISLCKSKLSDTPVKVCTVVGFPLGQNTMDTKAFETKNSIALGADEIDMVINVAALKSGDLATVEDDIRNVVNAANKTLVKVIIESCLLDDSEIKQATQLCEKAGADFVKTSTGFSSGGATLKDIQTISQSRTTDIKIKASGGIKDLETALTFIEAGANRLGASKGVEIIKSLK